MDRLRDRVIIVTGGAHGIGRTYCEGLAREGARVVVADLDGNGAAELVRTLEKNGHEGLAVQTDVSDPDATTRMAEAALHRFGRIHGLINNAAVFQRPAMSRVPFEQIPVDEWDRLMAVNLRGIFLCCRAVVPAMKGRRAGKIINISSGTVFYGAILMAHYVTSKAGVVGLTRALARELGEYNINVNAIAPGFFPTKMTKAILSELGDETANLAPLKRVGGPEDLKGITAVFASDACAFITGQTIAIDGGLTAI